MLIVIDKRIPLEAKKRLSFYGNVVEFATQNITYSSISDHPDIFLCQTPKSLICAPNLPKEYFDIFREEGVEFELGYKSVGVKFPETSPYNCLANEEYLFHKQGYSDKKILEQCKQLKFVSLPQAYTRCSLIALSSQLYITSDKGIEKALKKNNLEVHYFPPEEIVLPDAKHGFIGGALGLNANILFVIGNPDFHSWGKKFELLLEHIGLEIVSLYDGPFFDGGGIFFLE